MRVARWSPAGRIERKALDAEVSHGDQSASPYFKCHQSPCSVAFSAAC
jgi:hypothetical protein